LGLVSVGQSASICSLTRRRMTSAGVQGSAGTAAVSARALPADVRRSAMSIAGVAAARSQRASAADLAKLVGHFDLRGWPGWRSGVRKARQRGAKGLILLRWLAVDQGDITTLARPEIA
jgi:hypothetical protein